MKDLQMIKQVEKLSHDFKVCSKLLTAIGDETRLHLITEMLKMGKCQGVRVGEITTKTNLSRPAVSHHLHILKEAGLVKVRKEGTKNYYYFDPKMEELRNLATVLESAIQIVSSLPDRSEESL